MRADDPGASWVSNRYDELQEIAREKDARRRCDVEAGMAKLLAARILNIFEGAAEIRVHVIARRLPGGN